MATAVKEVKIEMKDGTEKLLKDITPGDLSNVKLTVKDGETNLTMKSVIVKTDAKFDVQRRMFKWTTMPNLVVYDLKVPKTMEAFKEVATDKEILDYAIGNYCIEKDKENNGVEAKGADPEKLAHKLIATLEAKGFDAKGVDAMKAMLKKNGFLK